MTAGAGPLSRGQNLLVLATAYAGLVGAGFQLGLMPLVALSATRDLLGPATPAGVAGDWFARYTAALMLGAAAGGILFGWLGDRIGRARALAASVLCYSIFGGAGWWAGAQEQLLLLRFLAGLGVGGMWPNGVALVSECWAGATRPMVAGVIGTGLNLGILLVSQLGRMRAVTPESWRWLVALGFVSAALGLCALLVLPESPKRRASRGAAAKPATPATPAAATAA